MNILQDLLNKNKRHKKCKGFETEDIGWGKEFDCGYDTTIDCDECMYGNGSKNPNAKRNKINKNER